MSNRNLRLRRQQRVRTKLKKSRNTFPRLSVFRSSKHIYAQLIDDVKGHTVASASSLDGDFKGKKGNDIKAATEVGKLIAKKASKAGSKKVIFDRGGFLYHGRIKALAEGAREGGLEF